MQRNNPERRTGGIYLAGYSRLPFADRYRALYPCGTGKTDHDCVLAHTDSGRAASNEDAARRTMPEKELKGERKSTAGLIPDAAAIYTESEKARLFAAPNRKRNPYGLSDHSAVKTVLMQWVKRPKPTGTDRRREGDGNIFFCQNDKKVLTDR